jgi:hypothetical protein
VKCHPAAVRRTIIGNTMTSKPAYARVVHAATFIPRVRGRSKGFTKAARCVDDVWLIVV